MDILAQIRYKHVHGCDKRHQDQHADADLEHDIDQMHAIQRLCFFQFDDMCRHHDIYIAQQQQRNDQSCAHCRKTKQIMVKFCVKRIPGMDHDGPGQRQRECKYHPGNGQYRQKLLQHDAQRALAMHPADEDLPFFFHDDAEQDQQDHNDTAAECQQNISLPI